MAGKLKTQEVILQSPNGLQEATLSVSDSGVVSSDKKVNLASDTTFNSLPMFACRAWVRFDGTGASGTNMTIHGSGNISSVYKNGTGDYTVTMKTAMPNANYMVLGSSSADNTGYVATYVSTFSKADTSPFYIAPTTTQFRVSISYSGESGGNAKNPYYVSLAVFC